VTAVIAYFYTEVNDNITMLFINEIFITIYFIQNSELLFHLLFMTYIPMTYLIYRLDEITTQIRTSIRRANKFRLSLAYERYVDFCNLVHNCALPYNIIIGLLYICEPYILVLVIMIFKNKRSKNVMRRLST